MPRKLEGLGQIIETARVDKDYSREKLSELVGVSTKHIYNIEHNRAMPSIRRFLCLIVSYCECLWSGWVLFSSLGWHESDDATPCIAHNIIIGTKFVAYLADTSQISRKSIMPHTHRISLKQLLVLHCTNRQSFSAASLSVFLQSVSYL